MRFSWVLVVPFVLLFPSSGAALVEVTKPVPVPASAPLSQEERARLREDLMRFADAFGAPGQAPATQAQSAVEPGPSKAEVSEGFHHKSALRSGCDGADSANGPLLLPLLIRGHVRTVEAGADLALQFGVEAGHLALVRVDQLPDLLDSRRHVRASWAWSNSWQAHIQENSRGARVPP